MKLLLDITDNKASFLMELLDNLPFVKATRVSSKEAAALDEIKQIHEAYKLAEKVRSGKLKSTPASKLLDEL